MTKLGHSRTEARRAIEENRGANKFWALKDVSFDVLPGEVIGVVGSNGAGKSTLLKILTRITEPTSGDAFINGRVASLLEVGTGFHPELTGRENIYMNGTILGMKKREIESKIDEIVAFSELDKFIDTPVKRYSSGMYVRLAFAVAAHLDPEILLIDEVLAVGDAKFQQKCIGKMSEAAHSGRTILFVSHNLTAIRALCPRSILIVNGQATGPINTNEALHQYIGFNQTGLCAEWYSPHSLEHHSGFAAAFLRQDGRLSSLLRISLSFQVGLVLTPCIATEHTLVTLQILNEDGDVIHHTADLYEDESAPIWRKGHRVVTIPPHALAPGRYSITPRLFQAGKELLDAPMGALIFEIMADGPALVKYPPNVWKGITGPGLFSWNCVKELTVTGNP
jgi:lipopolysaccharide transport system ATP-binding protein